MIKFQRLIEEPCSIDSLRIAVNIDSMWLILAFEDNERLCKVNSFSTDDELELSRYADLNISSALQILTSNGIISDIRLYQREGSHTEALVRNFLKQALSMGERNL